jgi:hypothetical protein
MPQVTGGEAANHLRILLLWSDSAMAVGIVGQRNGYVRRVSERMGVHNSTKLANRSR